LAFAGDRQRAAGAVLNQGLRVEAEQVIGGGKDIFGDTGVSPPRRRCGRSVPTTLPRATPPPAKMAE